jgi:ABC-2 type transport system ATP-binding protein
LILDDAKAAGRKMTVLVTTHYMDEAEQCDRLAFILDRRLIAEGAPDDLKQDLRGRMFEIAPHGDPFSLISVAQTREYLEGAYLFGVLVQGLQARASAQGARPVR